ncbi:MAG: hypothetical protein V4501_10020 [Pseudomonadota bacterium]
MSIVIVVQDTGRADSLMKIARNILNHTKEEIIFLIVGKAAKNLYLQLTDFDILRRAKVMSYENFFSARDEEHLEKNPLNSSQLDVIRTYLDSLAIDKVIIGSPSWHRALAPFQIAELIADRVTPKNAFIYDGDFYREEGCGYWDVLKRPDTKDHAWRKKFTWLPSLEGSKDLIPVFDPPLTIKVIGDPALDTALNFGSIPDAEIARTRKELNVLPAQQLLLVCGTKKIDEDLAMMDALLKHGLHENFQIRILLHSGTEDYNLHISSHLSLIRDHLLPNQYSIVINNFIFPKLNIHNQNNPYLINVNYPRDQIAAIPDRLCCAIPGTQATQAAINGIPVYCHLHTSYLRDSRIDTGPEGVISFLGIERSKRDPLTREDLGLSAQTSLSVVSGLLSQDIEILNIVATDPDPTLSERIQQLTAQDASGNLENTIGGICEKKGIVAYRTPALFYKQAVLKGNNAGLANLERLVAGRNLEACIALSSIFEKGVSELIAADGVRATQLLYQAWQAGGEERALHHLNRIKNEKPEFAAEAFYARGLCWEFDYNNCVINKAADHQRDSAINHMLSAFSQATEKGHTLAGDKIKEYEALQPQPATVSLAQNPFTRYGGSTSAAITQPPASDYKPHTPHL